MLHERARASEIVRAHRVYAECTKETETKAERDTKAERERWTWGVTSILLYPKAIVNLRNPDAVYSLLCN